MQHEEDNYDNEISTLTQTLIAVSFTEFFIFGKEPESQDRELFYALILIKKQISEEREKTVKKLRLRYATSNIVKFIEKEQKKERYKLLKRNAITGVVLRSFAGGGASIASGLVVNGIEYLYYRYPELFTKVKTKLSDFFLKTTADNKVTLNFKNIALTGGSIGATVILIMYFSDSSLPSRWLFESHAKRTALKKVPEVLPLVLERLVNDPNFETTTGKGLVPFCSRYKFIITSLINPLLKQVMAGNSIGYFLLSTIPFAKLSQGEFNITPYNVKAVMNIFTHLCFQQAENQSLISNFSGILGEAEVQNLNQSQETFAKAFALLTANNPTLSFVPTILTNSLTILTKLDNPVAKAKFITATVDGLVDGYLVRQGFNKRFNF